MCAAYKIIIRFFINTGVKHDALSKDFFDAWEEEIAHTRRYRWLSPSRSTR
jgi:hypothetical protein